MKKQLDDRAVSILKGNDKGGYTIPTQGLYPYQWLWDSGFCAMGIGEYDVDRAWVELESLFKGQWKNGMMPHMLFWQKIDTYFPGPDVWSAGEAVPSTGCSQPPIQSIAACRLLENNYNEESINRFIKLLPNIVASHRWFYSARDAEDNGVMAVIHPWESGRDNCPDWDEAMDMMAIDPDIGDYVREDTKHVDSSQRPSKEQYDKYLTIIKFGRDNNWDDSAFIDRGPLLVTDPGMTFILHRANIELLKMVKKIGNTEYVSEIEGWITKTEKGANDLWCSSIESYCAKNIRNGNFVEGVSSAAFLAFYAGLGSEEQRAALVKHLKGFKKAAALSVPSWDPRDDKFNSKLYWRGPVWPQMNYLISEGLRECGEEELAREIQVDTAEIIRKGGFYEYIDSTTGQGCGGNNFSWTAAIWLIWARDYDKQ